MSVRGREKRVCVCVSEIERHVDLHKTVRTHTLQTGRIAMQLFMCTA